MYLLDTNIISESTKPNPSSLVLSKLHLHKDKLCICIPIWHELLFGLHCLPQSKRRERLTHYLYKTIRPLPLYPYDLEAAEWYAIERARLKVIGKTPTVIDGQIAAIAKVNDLVLVTRNTADFKYFSDIQIENWFIE